MNSFQFPTPDEETVPDAKPIDRLLVLFRRLSQKLSPLVTGWMVVAIVLLGSLVPVMRPGQFVHQESGLQLRTPRGWYKEVSTDRNTVYFYKRPPDKGGKSGSVIKLTVEWGNPFGANSVDYLFNGVLTPARNTFGAKKVSVQAGPSELVRRRISWATVNFMVNYEDVYSVYATMANGRMCVLTLLSRGYDTVGDEAVLRALVDSVVISPRHEQSMFNH